MIYLLRHGRLPDSCGGKFIGQADIPLSLEGIEQAKRWAAFFSKQGVKFDHVFSSDLSRCKETAGIIAPYVQATFLPALREIALGEWDGVERREIISMYPDEWKKRGEDPAYAPPGGESLAFFYSRVAPALDEIFKLKGTKLIATHAGVIRCAICRIMDSPLTRLFSLDAEYAGLTTIDESKNPMSIRGFNTKPY
ncbi:MAG: histidine phosphatase family protein [Leptospirales bacterium]|nr:histidine phosphatase family protein [Leptospirales bacterium]